MIGEDSIYSSAALTITRLRRFLRQVLKEFLQNRGILLAGGVSYNILLSVIPMFAVITAVLAHVIDEQSILEIISLQAVYMTPAYADLVSNTVQSLVRSSEVIGWMGFIFLLFFSSFAFRMLEDAIAIIFHQPDQPKKRRFWQSVMMPYLILTVLGFLLLTLSLFLTGIHQLNAFMLQSFNLQLPFAEASRWVLSSVGFMGMFILYSAIYKVMPVIRICVKRAFIGGFIAALLWELVRTILAYYFVHLSLVNVIYGSMATLIVLLAGLEINAIIFLFGAQMIAVLEFNAQSGRPWYWVEHLKNQSH